MNKSKKILFLLSIILPLSLSSCALQHLSEKTNSDVSLSNSVEKSNVITISEAIELAEAAGGELTSEEYQITGIIEKVSNPTYGEMTIKDDTGSLYIYGVYGKDRQTRYDKLDDKPVKGDEVTLLGKLKMFNDKPEMDRGYLQSFKHNDISESIDLTQYNETTIANARTVANGTKMKLTGTVTRVTYSFGRVPNGFYLVGDNASIYVYSGDIASQVSEGNKVTLACEKAYFILPDEKKHAETFGYEGSCQVENVYLISNDKKQNEIDLNWCETSTIKKILETPLTTNITTNIFKVNAVVNKSEGKGYTNYYFNDLDNETGSYTYTMCNGSDFEWLDEFNGKICTVYLSPINCKSTNSGCIYRFVPIKVINENFIFDEKDAPAFAVEYAAKKQFKEVYNADPSLEVITSYKSELLGFENVTLEYTTNNENIACFEEINDKTIFHANENGEVTITIKATYKTYVSTDEVKVKIVRVDNIDYVNVKGAIDANDGETVTVRGIVAASLVNKTGFYIIDESGIIAVQTDADTLNKIEIGNDVIISGTKAHNKKEESINLVGQANIQNATLIANLEGKNDYSTASFDTTKTIEELYDLDVSQDYTTIGYRVSGKILKEETTYYSNIFVSGTDESKKMRLYCSSASQYSFLNEYVGQTLTIDLAVCNWNDKNYYTCCVLSITLEDGTKIVNNYNFKN